MCGIYMGKNGSYSKRLSHRGIRTRQSTFKNLVAVHEHLPIQGSINDRSILRTDQFLILFNGELFRDDIENDLHFLIQLFTNSETAEDAINEIKDIDGFYSFIIFDNYTNEITAFTDPLGKKQLYYSKEGISSEIKELITKGYKFDNANLSSIIRFGFNTDDTTPFEGIKRILPNKVYKFDINLNIIGLRHNYYEFSPSTGNNLYDLIDESVKNRLKGHKSIGMLLSGGLDSSIIKHHIDKTDIDVSTYCVDNEDDLTFATMMDKNVKSITLDYDKRALETMEYPIDLGSMYAQYSLCKNVDETVILTGDGADEVFGGYRRMHEWDSQYSDVFMELPFYHLIRLDRMSMAFTKELRSPFLSLKIIEYGLSLSHEERTDKGHLRAIYEGILPDEIINRNKLALKTNRVRLSDKLGYRKDLVKEFKDIKWI